MMKYLIALIMGVVSATSFAQSRESTFNLWKLEGCIQSETHYVSVYHNLLEWTAHVDTVEECSGGIDIRDYDTDETGSEWTLKDCHLYTEEEVGRHYWVGHYDHATLSTIRLTKTFYLDVCPSFLWITDRQ